MLPEASLNHGEIQLHMSFQQRRVGERGIYGQRDVKRNLWEGETKKYKIRYNK